MSGGNAFSGSAESKGSEEARCFSGGVDVVRRSGMSWGGSRFREWRSTVSRNVIAASYMLIKTTCG